MDYVLLQCKKVGGKLKVKMMSSQPFIKGFNCQFPKDIRQENMYYVILKALLLILGYFDKERQSLSLSKYIVKSSDIRLKGTFYSAMAKDIVVCKTFDFEEIKKYINSLSLEDKKIKPITIFGDDDNSECVICISEIKDTIFSPCGHYMTCKNCASQCKKCPICRSDIICLLSIKEMKSD